MAWSEPLDFAGSTLSTWSLPLDFAGDTLGPGTVTLVAPLADAGQRITAIPDLAAGDILEWSNVIFPLTEGPTNYGDPNYYNDIAYYATQFDGVSDNLVTIYTNGSFEAVENVTAFDVRAFDGEWSAWVTQTVGPEILVFGLFNGARHASSMTVTSSGTGVVDQPQHVSGTGAYSTALATASSGLGGSAFGTETHEYGTRLILVTGYDLSGNTELRIEVQRPDGVVVSYAGAMGAVDSEVLDDRGTRRLLTANEYIYRDWSQGDLELPGQYKARAVYVDANKELRSPQVVFQVAP